MREACAKGRDALASLWAAIGDRLCAGKPLDTAYAQRVAEECRAASRALEDVVPYGEIPMGAAPAPIATECGHESMTGLGHPRLWSCDGCGQITVEVDDTTGPCSDGTRRWRHEVIGSVDVKAARKFGPPMPATPADDAVALLGNAKKCVELVNDNGYYDVWLARCNRVLANAKRPADDAGDAVRDAAERVADCEPVDWDCSRAPGHPGLDEMIAAVANLRRTIAAERAQRDAGAEGDQRSQDAAKGGE